MNTLDGHEPGLVSLTPHRFVYWTGRIAVGLLYEHRQPDQGSQADFIQRLLTTQLAREPYWPLRPPPIDTRPPLLKRVLRMALR